MHKIIPKRRIKPRQLPYKIIEPLIRRDQLLHRAPGERARARSPEKQREMREVAALGEGAEH